VSTEQDSKDNITLRSSGCKNTNKNLNRKSTKINGNIIKWKRSKVSK